MVLMERTIYAHSTYKSLYFYIFFKYNMQDYSYALIQMVVLENREMIFYFIFAYIEKSTDDKVHQEKKRLNFKVHLKSIPKNALFFCS